ncbi:MAG: hypothetical protein A2951_01060 [Candidatus Buchananbacteria bacterium RIFCSPLOWO2_01_FULL_56_15]|uniref:YokE-like PH domain-containing protein n=2 Tax=Candidatus Buchananiibacteriota TaxID=1817903 RepID=A0A1G1YHK3_9BACT|nr:MAG: hypothetical protein A3J59_00385 [Candidatus Buchananbacteria bacterium RIFCSPHIGHO2_02_FULL_56_16]OGY55406.1 MAG: hypothetical protein A2951_01060 [Candidatus Buchananbacteria bacterium RIFCSPLOWO2_01_FULL_56_15]
MKPSRLLTLTPGEQLVLMVRQSPLQLVRAAMLPTLIIIAVFFMLFPLFAQGTVGIIIFAAMVTAGTLWLVRAFIVWYYRTLTITTKRIIDVDQQKLFNKTVSEVPLEKIQDVFYRVRGLGQTISRVGNVYLVLDDQKTRIEALNVSQPQKIQQLILKLRSETLHDRLDTTKLSAQELIELVKKIKAGLGEEQFKKIIDDDASDAS